MPRKYERLNKNARNTRLIFYLLKNPEATTRDLVKEDGGKLWYDLRVVYGGKISRALRNLGLQPIKGRIYRNSFYQDFFNLEGRFPYTPELDKELIAVIKPALGAREFGIIRMQYGIGCERQSRTEICRIYEISYKRLVEALERSFGRLSRPNIEGAIAGVYMKCVEGNAALSRI